MIQIVCVRAMRGTVLKVARVLVSVIRLTEKTNHPAYQCRSAAT